MNDPNITPECMAASVESLLKAGDMAGAIAFIEAHMAQIVSSPIRVNISNKLLAAMPWATLKALMPSKECTLVASGWSQSFDRMPQSGDGLPLPWFTHPAIEFLDRQIQPSWRVFEWGCGASTLFWSYRCTHVRGIESDPKWHAAILPHLPKNAEVSLHHDSTAYVNAIATASGPFDLIVIDGVWRDLCAEAALPFIGDETLVVLDNSDKPEIRDAVDALDRAGLYRIDFPGLIHGYAYKQITSILMRNPDRLKRQPHPNDFRSILGPTVDQALAG